MFGARQPASSVAGAVAASSCMLHKHASRSVTNQVKGDAQQLLLSTATAALQHCSCLLLLLMLCWWGAGAAAACWTTSAQAKRQLQCDNDRSCINICKCLLNLCLLLLHLLPQRGDYLKAALRCSCSFEGGGRNSSEVLPTEVRVAVDDTVLGFRLLLTLQCHSAWLVVEVDFFLECFPASCSLEAGGRNSSEVLPTEVHNLHSADVGFRGSRCLGLKFSELQLRGCTGECG